MNLIIQGSKNFHLSDRMKSYIEKKIEKIAYFKQHIKEIDFHLDHEKINYKVDVTIITHKFGNYQFSAQDLEMYTAIDKVLHKIDVKINREKTKIKDHTKASHEEIVQFFDHHDENKPEPTTEKEVNQKPTELQDAYLQVKNLNLDFYGFIDVKDSSIVFIRKLEDDILYLFKNEGDKYIEYSLNIQNNQVSPGNKIREIKIEKMNLLEAQKRVMDSDYHFTIFENSANGKISFLYKEANGKWTLMS